MSAGPKPSYIPHPREYFAAGTGPVAPVVATIAGGFLIGVQGALVEAYGAQLGLVYSIVFPGDPGAQGLSMIVTGGLVALIALLAYALPSRHRLDGARIWIVLFLINLPFALGAGFLVGTLLAAYGGTHLFFWKPPVAGGVSAIQRTVRRTAT